VSLMLLLHCKTAA